ncbi:D-alanine--D-alanine ligase [bacterium]|nr:D-alanine--D-alanine ligase [bacterium]
MEYSVEKRVGLNKKIAVLCGGMSNEREVSLRSGKNVFEALLRLGYKNAELVDVDENIASKLKAGQFEIAYNALHGKFGEDGCIKGILEILKIPYTGCGVMASSVCMNKDYTKRMLNACKDIPLIKSVIVKPNDNVTLAVKDLKYPLMLKPVSEGSSIGMYKVNNEKELQECFKKSLECKQDVMIEEYLLGVNCTVGVLEDKDKIFATEILEFRTKTEWYDYEAKYTKGLTEFILPAEISEDMTKKVKEIAVKAFNTCGCRGVSRVDFLISKNIPYVLEINTSPGMTDLSDLPAQSKPIGLNYDNLVQLILNGAGLQK